MSDAPHPLRRGTLAVTLAAVGAALFGGVAWRQLGLSDEERAAMAFRAARYCLVGADDGAPERSLRARIIAADLDVSLRDWPGRCAPPLDALRGRLDTLLIERRERCDSGSCCEDDEHCGDLARLRDQVDEAIAFARYGTDFDPTDLDAFGRTLGFADGEVPEGAPEPIAPAPLLDPAAMVPLYEGDYLRLLTDPDGDRGIELLFYEQHERYRWCTVPLVGGGAARCRDLAAQVPVGLAGELLAGEDGAPRRMYAQGPLGDEGWIHALYDVTSGAELQPISFRPQGGFVWRDGSIAWIGLEPPMEALSLFRYDATGAPRAPQPLDTTATSATPRLYHDELIWAEAVRPDGGAPDRDTSDGDTSDSDAWGGDASGRDASPPAATPVRQRLLARRLLPDGLGPVRVIGEVEGARPPALELCRTHDVLAILALTKRSEQGVRGALLLRGDDWHPPEPVHVGSARFGFTCHERTATLSWIAGDEVSDEPPGSWDDEVESPVQGIYGVHRLRCSAEGCRHDAVDVPLRRFGKSSRYVAGDLGASTVVMYRSPVGDVRMRVAPLAELPQAPDVPLFDDPEHDGFGWDLERDPIFGRGGAMIVLLSRQVATSVDSSVYAFRVDGNGNVRPVAVAPSTTSTSATEPEFFPVPSNP